MKSRHATFFSISAAVLFVTALAKLYSSGGSAKILALQDQLLHIGYRPLMVFAALFELGVGAVLLWSGNDLKRSLALLWLSSNFMAYRFGNYLLGVHICPCLGNLADRLSLPKGLADTALVMLLLYWFMCSLSILWRIWGVQHWTRLMAGLDSLLAKPRRILLRHK